MKTRGIVYLLALALIAYFLYSSNSGDEPMSAPQSITRQEIMADFTDLSDNDIAAIDSGDTFSTAELFFPADFNGDEGNEFYVTLEAGNTFYTQRYVIEKTITSADKTAILTYKLKVNWENFRPPAGKYESYKFDGEKWSEMVGEN